MTDCLVWSAPSLRCLTCLPAGVTVDDVGDALAAANQMAADTSGRRWNGGQCLATFQICPKGCTCLKVCECDPCMMELVDVAHYLGGPVLEVVGVIADGTAADPAVWTVIRRRFLSPPSGTWRQRWTVTVRYGDDPPAGLLRLRDQLFYSLLAECAPKSDCMACQPKDADVIVDEIRRNFTRTVWAASFDPTRQHPEYDLLLANTQPVTPAAAPPVGHRIVDGVDVTVWIDDWLTRHGTTPTPAPVITPGAKVFNELGQPI